MSVISFLFFFLSCVLPIFCNTNTLFEIPIVSKSRWSQRSVNILKLTVTLSCTVEWLWRKTSVCILSWGKIIAHSYLKLCLVFSSLVWNCLLINWLSVFLCGSTVKTFVHLYYLTGCSNLHSICILPPAIAWCNMLLLFFLLPCFWNE